MQINNCMKNVIYAVEESWGFWKIKSKEALEKATHVVVPLSAYREMVSYINVLNNRTFEMKKMLEDKDSKIIGLERIMRERSNQIRGVVPKKEFDGYVVTQSQQLEEVYEYPMPSEEYDEQSDQFKVTHAYIENQEPIVRAKIKVWKTSIQTPVNATMPAAEAEKIIYDALLSDLLMEMGCEYLNEMEENGVCAGFIDEETGTVVCRMYKWRIKANFRANLWEVDIFTTKELDIPEYRKPVFYQKDKMKKVV